MGLGTHWEREKNAAILELDRRNKNLQSKLLESTKEGDAVSSQVSSQGEKMHQSILHAIHEAFENEAVRKSYVAPITEDPAPPNQLMGGASMWEWKKNTALLELEQRNQQLQCLLKSKDKNIAASEQDKALLEGGFERGKECMRLYAQVRAMQESIVQQTQRISQSRRLNAIMYGWHRLVKHSRKCKILRKSELTWDRRILWKTFAALAANRAMSRTSVKLVTAAEKHRVKTLMLQSFQLWMLRIQSTKVSRERVAIFRMLQKTRMSRMAFGACKTLSEVLARKTILKQKVERFFSTRCIRKSWQTWKSLVAVTHVHAFEAEDFCKQRRLGRALQTWIVNVQDNIVEKAQNIRSNQHKKVMLLQKSFKTWHEFSRLEALMQRRLVKSIHCKIRRVLLFTFIGWKQYVKNKKEVRIWRNVSYAKQILHLKQQAFTSWNWHWKRKQKILSFQAQQSTKMSFTVIQAWSLISQKRKYCKKRMCNMQKRTDQRQMKDMFYMWLMYVEGRRKSAIARDAKLLQARLELSQEDLQGAGNSHAEMTKLVKCLEKERMMMIRNIDAVSARTPVWTSGFLDAELRWTFPQFSMGSAPSARAGHIAVALNVSSYRSSPSHIVVAGGYNGYSILNDIFVLHAAEDIWRIPKVSLKPGSALPPPVRHHTACAHQNKIVIFGGFDGSRDSAELSLLEFSEDGFSCEWSQPDRRVGIIPGPMSQHSSCLSRDGNHMVVFGGYRSNVGHLNELWILDLQWMVWHSPDYYGDPPSARRGHGAVIIGTKMYVFGGYDGKSNLGDLHALDLEAMQWDRVKVQGEAPTARRQHAMAAVGRHFVIYGGYDGESYLEDVYSLDTETCIWKRWTIMKPSVTAKLKVYGRSMHAMVPSGHGLVIFGGVHEHGPLQDVLYLENGAAVDGLELQRELTEERNKVQTLQEQVIKCEEMLQQKVADLALAYSKVAQCQAALKIEAKERKTAVSRERVLIQKLRKIRKKSSLW